MAITKVGAGLLHSPPYFTFENFFFPPPKKKNLMYYPAGPKSECVLFHGSQGTGPSVLWLCSSGTALWSLGLCHSSSGTLSLSRELTTINCVFNLPAVSGAYFMPPHSQPRAQGSPGRVSWAVTGRFGSRVRETGPLQGWLWERMCSVTHQAADKSWSSPRWVTFWLCWWDKMGFDDFWSFLNSMQDSLLISVFLSSKVIIKGMTPHVQSRRWFGKVQQDYCVC